MTFCPRDLLQGSPFGSLSCLPTAEFWGVTTRSSSGPHLVTIGSGHKHRHRGSSLGPPPLTSWRALSLPPTRKLSFQPAPLPLPGGGGDKICFSLPIPDVRACASTPCAHNGTCVNLDSGHYECSCAPGFSGKDCQKKDGPCVING